MISYLSGRIHMQCKMPLILRTYPALNKLSWGVIFCEKITPPPTTTFFPLCRNGIIFPWGIRSKFDVLQKKDFKFRIQEKLHASWDFWLWGITKEGLTLIIGLRKKFCLVTGCPRHWKKQNKHSVYQVNPNKCWYV